MTLLNKHKGLLECSMGKIQTLGSRLVIKQIHLQSAQRNASGFVSGDAITSPRMKAPLYLQALDHCEQTSFEYLQQ